MLAIANTFFLEEQQERGDVYLYFVCLYNPFQMSF